MAQTVRIRGATYSNVPAISVPDANNVFHSFYDTSDADATAADIVSGATAYVNGSKLTGSLVVNKYYTGSTAPSASLGNNGDIYLQE